MEEKLQQLEQRIDAIEKSDRLQAERITLIQKVQTACMVGISVGFLLGFNVIIDPTNRAVLERVASGAIAASLAGMVGSGFLEGKKDG